MGDSDSGKKNDIVRAQRRVMPVVREAEVRSEIASKVHMHFEGRTICNLYLCIDVINKDYPSRTNEIHGIRRSCAHRYRDSGDP